MPTEPQTATTAESAGDNGSDKIRDDEQVRHRQQRGCGRRLGRVLLVVLALALLVAAWEWLTWPDVPGLAERPPESTAFIDRARHQGEVTWTWVAYGNISPHLKRAVLVSEDLGFFHHDGFERAEVEIAWREAWKEKRLPRGASTLTQQAAKNLYLSPSLNPWRKVKEAMLTRELEKHLSKRRIFEIYLNVAEFGPGIYGAEAAARRYFGKSAAALGEGEAAQLAAALPRPKSWHPGVTDGRYQWKVRLIRQRMAQAGWLWKVI